MIGKLRFGRNVGRRPRSFPRGLQGLKNESLSVEMRAPLRLDMKMHAQQTRVTSAARFAMPRIRSRFCCKYCWSSGARTFLASVFRSEQNGRNQASATPPQQHIAVLRRHMVEGVSISDLCGEPGARGQQ
jgi:hypothetical protein